jgi:hypothetical protein
VASRHKGITAAGDGTGKAVSNVVVTVGNAKEVAFLGVTPRP